MDKIGVVVWCRIPLQKSKAKTRIATEIGDQELANQLSLMLARVTLSNVMASNVDMFIYHQQVGGHLFNGSDYFGDNINGYFAYNNRVGWLENTWLSLRKLLDRGYKKAVALVSDCPYFLNSRLQEVSKCLDQNMVVLCPATDKGINAYAVTNFIKSNCFYANNILSRSPNYDLTSELTEYLSRHNYSFTVMNPPLPDIDSVRDVRDYWKTLNDSAPIRQTMSVRSLQEIYDFLLTHRVEFKLNEI